MYQALYRKYRPKTFSEVVGQQHITDTLQRQVADGQVGHAYLFTGTRGTGKTTCARILAKAVNCQHPIDGAPCNQCAACRGIDDGSLLDVTELTPPPTAASTMPAACGRRPSTRRRCCKSVSTSSMRCICSPATPSTPC